MNPFQRDIETERRTSEWRLVAQQGTAPERYFAALHSGE